ncbi:CLIP domain-containing serine protease 2-like isoform X2 [Nilaparvata lugens]|uniref:Easter-8 n=2 Tax=Nilaparvata lugens TaxID=108931 RepID=A0A068F665_NILLU|nr:CLIP domain-containing serine protease 2-like isoform X2 [Nilaparvata lugens]XP_039290868.1 CLIP domain-containing serine protease 2-like isoform X2 [Nilaparvata lugens]XP_039290869.1 CLIP domain-containing serine protease 2-like isoform X2 [Nilaparvata lugens]XP_039290870.1 CLIP domain-containing serine protease 2-like isoform X2 [Nilaparvata lugens]AID60292.1 easter-8 [Nilaparvata lugens]APA33884.1 seminal fluid protein [Nilaparvata lugens]
MGLRTYILLVFLPGLVLSQGIDQHRNFNLINDEKCGISNPIERQIHHGAKASLGQFPWMVLIEKQTKEIDETNQESYYQSKCGGTILNSKYILTAAHCFWFDERTTLLDADFIVPDCTRPGDVGRVIHKHEEVILHPGYDITTDFINDIALIRVKGRIIFNDMVAPICLEHGRLLEENYAGVLGSVAGFGYIEFKDTFSDLPGRNNPVCTQDLHYLPNYPILDDEKCWDEIQTCCRDLVENLNRSILPSQICAGGQVEKFTTVGDSGSPLMVLQSEGAEPPRYYQVGIVSYARLVPVFKHRFPTVYCRVRFYLEWILDNMKPL